MWCREQQHEWRGLAPIGGPNAPAALTVTNSLLSAQRAAVYETKPPLAVLGLRGSAAPGSQCSTLQVQMPPSAPTVRTVCVSASRRACTQAYMIYQHIQV